MEGESRPLSISAELIASDPTLKKIPLIPSLYSRRQLLPHLRGNPALPIADQGLSVEAHLREEFPAQGENTGTRLTLLRMHPVFLGQTHSMNRSSFLINTYLEKSDKKL